MAFGLRRAKVSGLLSVPLVSKISNLCGPDPPISQTDRRTDNMRSQYRALHYSASCGKNFQSAITTLSERDGQPSLSRIDETEVEVTEIYGRKSERGGL